MKVNVFCFPYAGGSKYSYNYFTKNSPENLNFIQLEYPGRGSRLKENLLIDLDKLVNDLFTQIRPHLSLPYVFYGHSMGTIVGFLITKKIIEHNLPNPLHLFFSGRGGPSLIYMPPFKYQLPANEFKLKLKELGGCPDEVLNDESLMKFYEPILRSDFEALENYKHITTEVFDIPITVMIGKEENISMDQALSWQKETSQRINVKQFPGKHFFIFDYSQEIVHLIAEVLNRQLISG